MTGVTLIPLSSQLEAKNAIIQAKESSKKGAAGQGEATDDSDTSDDEDVYPEDSHAEDDESQVAVSASPTNPASIPLPGDKDVNTNVVEDVIGRKGQYGRFADRWFSKKGWSAEKKKAQGMSTDTIGRSQVDGGVVDSEKPDRVQSYTSTITQGVSGLLGTKRGSAAPSSHSSQSKDPGTQNAALTLLPKLLRTTKILFGSRSFFFSYDYDITRRLGSQEVKNPEIPIYKTVDPLVRFFLIFNTGNFVAEKQTNRLCKFFWNRHLALPFINGGHQAFVLPLMQGFIGQRAFTIDNASERPSQNISRAEEDPTNVIELQNSEKKDISYLLTLISRRSVLRPGLRYLRRGVDDDGHTANSVETEQILSKASWGASNNKYSFTQIRGSIPLFFSQSPYSFKPVPVLQHSPEANHVAFRRHFANIQAKYGPIQIVLLVDKHGGEMEIGQQYEKHTQQLNEETTSVDKKLAMTWWDYHTECRGMKFENVVKLVDLLDSKIEDFGWTVEQEDTLTRKQGGVLRTNCMDCLDRTNVVQSACAQRVLESQLKQEGLEVNLQNDPTTQWFNTLWADNGDAISKQYSSTAALKGDYTRTRKRNYRGALNDFGLTLSRYFNNIVNDYFSQAAIDFFLGNVTAQVFEEFEADMMSGDPAMSMPKVRANAIDTSQKLVVADQNEDLIGGWTLLSPREPNTVRTFPFEEVVLLVTNAALYAVRFDWNMEKVSSFERVDLRSITGIICGTYVTSTLAAAQMDEQRNVGFVVKYRPGKEDIARVNTRSLNTIVDEEGDYENSKAKGVEREERKSAEGVARQQAELSQAQDNTDSAKDQPKPKSKSTENDPSTLKILAFKALPARSSLASSSSSQHAPTERELVRIVSEEIKKAIGVGNGGDGGGGNGNGKGTAEDFIENSDIISLVDARRSTGLLEQWGHSLKKFVWA